MMRWTIACAVILCAALAWAEDKADLTITFGKGDLGKLPSKWNAARTGEGKGSVWKVVEDKTAPSKSGCVLAQLAEGPTRLFNIAVAEESKFKDGQVSVKFKAVAGKIDQGGGVVWRYRDADNYYVCRYNPLEENFRAYKVTKGKRLQLATKEDVPPKKDHWYTLSVSQKGDAISCSLEGKQLLEVKDDAFKDEGQVGLWTKADAVTHFDELTVTAK